jgi:hypothetical protein
VKAGDLPAAVTILTEPTDQALHYEAGMINLLAEPNEVMMSHNPLDLAVQAKKGALFLVG